MSTLQGSVWDFKQLFMAAKIEKQFLIEKSFTQFPQILADVRYASSTIYLIGMGWLSLRRLFVSLSS